MMIQVAKTETMLEEVANLPEVEEPTFPKCNSCGQSFAEPREGDTCIVCLTKEGKAPPSIAEQARAEVAAAKPEARPSLEVAIDTHKNLMPRIGAMCSRLLAWDVAELGDIGEAFATSVRDLRDRCAAVGVQLQTLAGMGFIAKTSAKSRRDRAIAENKVALSDATRSAWSKHYSEEELAQVSIVATDGEMVWVNIGNRPNPMPVPLKRTQLVPA